MAIATLDQYIASAKQQVALTKNVARTTTANTWFSVFDLAGNPGAGALAGTSTTAGILQTSGTQGYPALNAFGGSATGYLTNVDFGNTVAARMMVYDTLWKGGAYTFNSGTTTLSAQPSYSGRVPSGTDFTNTQIWIEVSTAFVTGTSWTIGVTYTSHNGTAARTSIVSAAQAAAGLTQGKMFQLALQTGDSGVQKIESVICSNGGTAMTAGAVNVLVIRPLWSGRCRVINDGDVHALDKTGMPIVFATSALTLAVNPDGGLTGIPELLLEIANN